MTLSVSWPWAGLGTWESHSSIDNFEGGSQSRTVLEIPTGNLYFSLVVYVFLVNIFEPNHHKIKQQGHKKTPISKPKPPLSPSEIGRSQKSPSLWGLTPAPPSLHMAPESLKPSESGILPTQMSSEATSAACHPCQLTPVPLPPHHGPKHSPGGETKANSRGKQGRPQCLSFAHPLHCSSPALMPTRA